MIDAWLTPDRRRSLVHGAIGAGGGWFVLALLVWICGAPSIMGAVAWALLVPAVLMMGFTLAVMAVRMHVRAFDPVNAADPPAVRAASRALTNTLEQAAVFAPSAVVIALTSGPAVRQLVPALAITFLLARVVFWVGYLTAPVNRAVGMAATLGVNAVALLAALIAA